MPVKIVPMSTDAAPGGDPLMQAMMAQRQQQSPGRRMMEAGSRPQPVFNTAQGMMMLANGALGGFLEGRDERNQRQAQIASGAAVAQLARQTGLPEDAIRQVQAVMTINPQMGQALAAKIFERVLNPPATFAQETRPDGSIVQRNTRTNEASMLQQPPSLQPLQIGTDFMGNPRHGAFNSRSGGISPLQDPRQPAAPQPAPQGLPQAAPQAAEDPRRAELRAMNYPDAAPLPPPGVNPRTFLEKWSERQTSSAMPASGDFVTGLRKEVMQSTPVKKVNEAVPILNSMVRSAGLNSRASDIDFVYGIGKIFDPESVVREGEMVMVRRTGSVPDQVVGLINMVNGGQSLTPPQRAAILSVARTRVGEYVTGANADLERFGDIATRNRADPRDVLPNLPQVDEAGLQAYLEAVQKGGSGISGTLNNIMSPPAAAPSMPLQAPVPEPRPTDIPQAAPQGMQQGTPQEPAPAPQGLTLEMIDAAIAERQRQMQLQQMPQQAVPQNPLGGISLGGMGIP